MKDLERARQLFFFNTKVGQAISSKLFDLYSKHKNSKILGYLLDATLPF